MNKDNVAALRERVQVGTEKEDLRITRTKKTLYRTMLDLLERQSFEDITVKQICKEAMVNRATFYKHFLDKNHLLTEAIKDLSRNELTRNQHELSMKEMLQESLTFATNHRNLFLKMLSEERDSLRGLIKEDLRKRIRQKLATEHALSPESTELKLVTEAQIGAVISVIVWCLENKVTKIHEPFDTIVKNRVIERLFHSLRSEM